MHADLGDFKAGIVPGATTSFEAHLTNFGLYPQKIERCEDLSDTKAHEGRIAYRLEQMDNTTHGWKTLFDSVQNFCRSDPRKSKVIKKLLWTGQTLSTGLDERVLPNNETMRLVIEANGREFPTMPFSIIEVYGR